jgi:multidrug efflux pump subunit AcrA (membrane-fusion protein)
LDIARAPQPKRRRNLLIGAGILALVIATVALTRLEPRAPSVERATLWVDSVSRGEFVRQVKANGTLVPERVVIISAVTAGRVEALPLRPGVTVTGQTVIAKLTNPDVQLQLLDAQSQLTSAQAELANLSTNLASNRLNQEGQVAQVQTQYNEALRQQKLMEALDKRQAGLASANEIAAARERVGEFAVRLKAEKERLKLMEQAVDQQLALQDAQVKRLQAIVRFNEDRIASMDVKAGEDGVLTEQPLELGQWVVPGQRLARVAQPGRLKAELRVPETQAKDIAVGQPTSIDTRNGLVAGRVMRIDPISQNGTVTVEVALEGTLPRGARPDLSVDGTIEIERLTNVLYLGRPAYGQPESTVGLFKIEPDGKHASRTNVKLGRSSVNTIEVIQGLQPGDKVIISDMSAWDNVNRVRLQ